MVDYTAFCYDFMRMAYTTEDMEFLFIENEKLQ